MQVHLLILSHCHGCIYICFIRHRGASLTQPDWHSVTSVLPVSAGTSAVAGVIHWVWVAAVGLWAAACVGVAGATDGCAVGAVGALINE